MAAGQPGQRTGLGARVMGAALAAAAALLVVGGAAALPVVTARATAGTAPVPAVARTSPAPRPTVATGPACPLTGQAAPGGTVPARPALAVKVDNYPNARPQTALDQADMVWEEPVEGGITRLVAVFQCQAPPLIGPVRSARSPDVAIADALSHPLLVHAGGINPVLAMLDAANLTNVDIVFRYSSLTLHPPGRYAPYDTYVSADTMWQTSPRDTTPPAPVFSYGAIAPGTGTPAGSVHIPFSGTNDDTWTWDAPSGRWDLSIGGTAAMTAVGDATDTALRRVTASDVVVLKVHTFQGPWLENNVGGYEVEVVSTGSGPATVLRDGRAINGTWERPSLSEPPRLVDGQGRTIDLAPGRTWVELVPTTVPVTVGSPTAGGSSSGGPSSGGSAGGGPSGS